MEDEEKGKVEPHEAMTGQRRHLEFGPILALHTQEWTNGRTVRGSRVTLWDFEFPVLGFLPKKKKNFFPSSARDVSQRILIDERAKELYGRGKKFFGLKTGDNNENIGMNEKKPVRTN